MNGAWCSVPFDHPALHDHFPGNPVLPAVVVLEQVVVAAARANLAVRDVPAARLLREIRPGEPFFVRFMPRGGSVRFVVESPDGTTLARGRMEAL